MRIVDGQWTLDRPTVPIDPFPPPPVPFEGARVSEPLQDAWVAMRSDLESKLKHTPTPAASGLRNVAK